MPAQPSPPIEVYLEVGRKRTFAGAVEWPGWCRSGRDEASALQALLEYGKRYASVLDPAGLAFQAPDDLSALAVVERLEGNATTDFGAPSIAPSADARPVGEDELERFRALLAACWQAFDASVQAAAGRALRAGPRGGGRDVDRMIRHVLGGDEGYLAALGWKVQKDESADLPERLDQTRQAVLEALGAAARGELPASGPRGGLRWTPRYFVRRVAWHVLDHAWELEDRVV